MKRRMVRIELLLALAVSFSAAEIFADRVTPPIVKQPGEVLDYAHDFALKLASGETISIDSVTTKNLDTGADSSAQILGSGAQAPAVSGTKVIFWLKNGADGERHQVTIRISTNQGRKFETDQTILIREL